MYKSFKNYTCYTVILFCSIIIFCGPKPQIKEDLTQPVNYINPVFIPVQSIVSIPIAIQPAFLENLINKHTKELLYQNDSLKIIEGISNAQLKVSRTDQVRIGLLGDELHYRIPLKLWLRINVGVGSVGIFQDFEGGIALRMRTTITIRKDWSLVTQTIIDGYDWINEPVVKVAGMTIPFKPVADMVLSTLKGSFGKMVDGSVQNNLDLKKIIEPIWLKIQKPIPLYDSLGLWLKLSPDSIFMTQLKGYNGSIISSIGLKTIAETYWGGQPVTDTIKHLPELRITPAINSSFMLNLYSEITYSHAQSLARQMLCGKSFDISGKKICIDSLWINGDSGLMRVDASLSGSFKGAVSFIGRPGLDTLTHVLSIEDISFDMKTKNILMSTAKWMLNGVLQKKISEFLKFPLDQELEKLRTIISTSLINYKPYNDFKLIGNIDTLTIRGFALKGSGIRVSVLAEGKIGVKLETIVQFF